MVDVSRNKEALMKIVLIESLKVDENLIKQLAQPLQAAGHEFIYYPDRATDPGELYERIKDAEIVMLANQPLPAEVVAQLDQTQLLNVAFTGVDHLPVQLAKEKSIQIANAAGYSTTAVAELVIGLTLGLYRKIKESDQDLRQGAQYAGSPQGLEINQKKVGIVGTGQIGSATARLFKAFGAEIIAYNRSHSQTLVDEIGLRYVSLDQLLQEADIVSLHLPLTESTRHLIGEREFNLMKETALLINCARGPIVDSHALVQALQDGKIAGAGLDVYDQEPPLADDTTILSAPHTLLTPHIGYYTQEAMVQRAHIAFENTLRFIQGQPQNLI